MMAVRIALLTLANLMGAFVWTIGAATRTAYKRAYFRATADATVLSGDVSREARLGRKVFVARNVRIFRGVSVGDYSSINPDVLLESGTIGKFCSIASRVAIGMDDHPMRNLSTHVATYDSPACGLISKPRPNPQKAAPAIGNDVWIARGATVLRGVTVGDGAVIGAGTLVTGDIPPYAVAVGVPARVIRYRFDEETIAALLRRRWWDDEAFYGTEFERRGLGIENFDIASW